MRHLFALMIKFIIVGTIIFSILGLFSSTSFMALFVISGLITLASYIIGDMYILYQVGNVAATIIDFVIYFLAVWTLAGSVIGIQSGITLASLAAAYFLTLAEPLFHAYVIERVFHVDIQEDDMEVDFQTEASEEKVVDIDELKRKIKKKRK
ncbi:MAG TPA: DUF2512 family protein [Bacillota bacterium]|nr:DUF2512 family protein [Bacillota bacterium]